MKTANWRVKKRIRTVSGGIILCMHLGIDPPDIIKTIPAARTFFWVNTENYADLNEESALKIKHSILQSSQSQFEFWQPKARLKTILDPTIEEVRRLCSALRRGSKEERILLYYNGHGVPKPTTTGEIWAFNKNYTQYVPLPVTEVLNWAQYPLLLIVDCSGAQSITKAIPPSIASKILDDLINENPPALIVMGCCGTEEILPMTPEMPADLFTAALTTPLDTAILWHMYNSNILKMNLSSDGLNDKCSSFPGRINDRKSPRGLLNWVLSSILESIACSILDRATIKLMLRQDPMLASMIKNFVLASRILVTFRCSPFCYPLELDTLAILSHPLWEIWDQILETSLDLLHSQKMGQFETLITDYFTSQLDAFENFINHQKDLLSDSVKLDSIRLDANNQIQRYIEKDPPGTTKTSEQHCNSPSASFFYEPDDLDEGRENRLDNLNLLKTETIDCSEAINSHGRIMDCPINSHLNLPALIQILLCQDKRPRAITLLADFCDFGNNFVDEILIAGFFPFLLKLLSGSSSSEIMTPLLRIWIRVLLYDPTCARDLLKDDLFTLIALPITDAFIEEDEDEMHPTSTLITEEIELSLICLVLFYTQLELSKQHMTVLSFGTNVLTKLLKHLSKLPRKPNTFASSKPLSFINPSNLDTKNPFLAKDGFSPPQNHLNSMKKSCMSNFFFDEMVLRLAHIITNSPLTPTTTTEQHPVDEFPLDNNLLVNFLSLQCNSPNIECRRMSIKLLGSRLSGEINQDRPIIAALAAASSDPDIGVKLCLISTLPAIISMYKGRLKDFSLHVLRRGSIPIHTSKNPSVTDPIRILWKMCLLLACDVSLTVRLKARILVDEMHATILRGNDDLLAKVVDIFSSNCENISTLLADEETRLSTVDCQTHPIKMDFKTDEQAIREYMDKGRPHQSHSTKIPIESTELDFFEPEYMTLTDHVISTSLVSIECIGYNTGSGSLLGADTQGLFILKTDPRLPLHSLKFSEKISTIDNSILAHSTLRDEETFSTKKISNIHHHTDDNLIVSFKTGEVTIIDKYLVFESKTPQVFRIRAEKEKSFLHPSIPKKSFLTAICTHKNIVYSISDGNLLSAFNLESLQLVSSAKFDFELKCLAVDEHGSMYAGGECGIIVIQDNPYSGSYRVLENSFKSTIIDLKLGNECLKDCILTLDNEGNLCLHETGFSQSTDVGIRTQSLTDIGSEHQDHPRDFSKIIEPKIQLGKLENIEDEHQFISPEKYFDYDGWKEFEISDKVELCVRNSTDSHHDHGGDTAHKYCIEKVHNPLNDTDFFDKKVCNLSYQIAQSHNNKVLDDLGNELNCNIENKSNNNKNDLSIDLGYKLNYENYKESNICIKENSDQGFENKLDKSHGSHSDTIKKYTRNDSNPKSDNEPNPGKCYKNNLIGECNFFKNEFKTDNILCPPDYEHSHKFIHKDISSRHSDRSDVTNTPVPQNSFNHTNFHCQAMHLAECSCPNISITKVSRKSCRKIIDCGTKIQTSPTPEDVKSSQFETKLLMRGVNTFALHKRYPAVLILTASQILIYNLLTCESHHMQAPELHFGEKILMEFHPDKFEATVVDQSNGIFYFYKINTLETPFRSD